MSDQAIYVVTAGYTEYPLAADWNWRELFKSEQEALEFASTLTDEWVAIIEINTVTLEHRVVRQRQS